MTALKKRCRSMLLPAFFVAAASAFISAAAGPLQPYQLVDGHTAGVLSRGSVNAEIRNYATPDFSGSGLLLGLSVGITNRFTIGLAYGGEGIIGYGDEVRWNPVPGVVAKYRIVEESFVAPAVAIGFDNQGYGGRASTGLYGYDGYVYKSPGFFAAVSKSYVMMKKAQIGFHGTINYSLEEADEVKWPNVLFGMDIGINEELMFVAEYNMALNDISGGSDTNYVAVHQGFLSFGLRWAFTENFHLQFDMKDIFGNKTTRTGVSPLLIGRPVGWSRELKVVYISRF